jgi:hypothetical protein
MNAPERKRPHILQKHCWNLAVLLQNLWQECPDTVTNKDGVTFEWLDAAEWLDLAAGVSRVEVVTGFYNESLMYCESALAYEDARSDCLSLLAGQLSIFTFVWGAFEIIGNVVDPPVIPVKLRSHGENSLVDRVVCHLRTFVPYPEYVQALDRLNEMIDKSPQYSRHRRRKPLPAFLGKSGMGIDLVRRVRNQFAHGAARFPRPDEWGDEKLSKPSLDQIIIAYCTETTLLTMQMLLDVHFAGKNFDIRCADGEEDDIHAVLERLHKVRTVPNETDDPIQQQQ